MTRPVDFSELDAACCRILLTDPGSYRTKWLRRWLWGIDKSVEAARKAESSESSMGLLAGAAVSLIEARDVPLGEEHDYNFSLKLNEASRLISLALEGLP